MPKEKESHHSTSSSSSSRESKHHHRDRTPPVSASSSRGSSKERKSSASSSPAKSSTRTDYSESRSKKVEDKSPTKVYIKQEVEEEKENPEPTMTKREFYESVSEYENNEASQLDIDSHLDNSIDVCKRLEALMGEMYEMKLAGDMDSPAFANKKMEGLMLLTSLRRINRLFKLRIKIEKDQIAEHRQKADSDHLRLQNLIYEATHLKDQVLAMQDYKGVDEDIDLIPVEQFYREAPETIAKLDKTSKDNHMLRIARLEYEYKQRRMLAEKCIELENSKQKITEELGKEQAKLDSVGPILTNILEAAKPLEGLFDIDISRKSMITEYINYLPTPLYVLYVSSVGYSEFLESPSFKVKICGDIQAAQKLEKLRVEAELIEAEENSRMEIDDEETGDQEMEEISKRRLRKHSSVYEEKVDERTKCLQRHPLYIEWTLLNKGGETMTMKFYFLIKFRVITLVTSFNPQYFSSKLEQMLSKNSNILIDLFHNDEGLECPNPSSSYILDKLDIENFAELVPELGYPYKWAQKVAGLVFLPENIEMSDCAPPTVDSKVIFKASKASMPGIHRLLVDRLENKCTLWSLLKSLESGQLQLPVVLSDCFAVRPADALTFSSWEPLDRHEYEAYPCAKDLLSEKVISPDEVFLKFVLDRGQRKLTALVAVPNDYPEAFSTITLQFVDGEEQQSTLHGRILRELEKEVNVTVRQIFQAYRKDTLKIQLRILMDRLDNIELNMEDLQETVARVREGNKIKMQEAMNID